MAFFVSRALDGNVHVDRGGRLPPSRVASWWMTLSFCSLVVTPINYISQFRYSYEKGGVWTIGSREMMLSYLAALGGGQAAASARIRATHTSKWDFHMLPYTYFTHVWVNDQLNACIADRKQTKNFLSHHSNGVLPIVRNECITIFRCLFVVVYKRKVSIGKGA